MLPGNRGTTWSSRRQSNRYATVICAAVTALAGLHIGDTGLVRCCRVIPIQAPVLLGMGAVMCQKVGAGPRKTCLLVVLELTLCLLFDGDQNRGVVGHEEGHERLRNVGTLVVVPRFQFSFRAKSPLSSGLTGRTSPVFDLVLHY